MIKNAQYLIFRNTILRFTLGNTFRIFEKILLSINMETLSDKMETTEEKTEQSGENVADESSNESSNVVAPKRLARVSFSCIKPTLFCFIICVYEIIRDI